jgi:hypothetical protein
MGSTNQFDKPQQGSQKPRRTTVRRYVPRRRIVFDEQQWPVNIVLVVLGGFLIGGILAYQRFDDPRWYASPWLSLTLVLFLITTTMMTLRMIDNRKFKRTMQFSVVVCAIVHLVMLIYSVESMIFSKGWNSPIANKQLVRKKQRKQMEYHPTPQQQADKPDFLKPIDSEVPEPTPPEVERQQQEDPVAPEPVEQQPQPDPQPQVKPEVVRKNSSPNSSMARQSDTSSRLTKRDVKMPETPQVTVDVSQNTVRKPSQPKQAKPTRQVARSQSSTTAQKITIPKVVETPAQAQAANVQRAVTEPNQEAAATNNASRATTKRQTAENQEVPKTQVQPVENQQATSQRTPQPLEVVKNTAARQQQTATPTVRPQQTPPTPTIPEVTSAEPVKRQSPMERQTVQSSSPQQSRTTPQPQNPVVKPIAAAAQNSKAEPTPTPAEPQPNQTAQKANTQSPAATPRPPTPPAPAANAVRVTTQQPNRAVTSANAENPNSQASQVSQVTRNRSAESSVTNPMVTATAQQRPTQQAISAPAPNAAAGAVARANTNRRSNTANKLTSIENNPQPQVNKGSTISQRRASANQVSATNTNQSNDSPQRSSRVATATASPTNADVPANSRSVATNQNPSLDASSRATSRAQQGTTGGKTGRNQSTAAAAAESSSKVSATAAIRAEATRSTDANASSSSDVASVQRNRTQANVASAIRPANTTAEAMLLASRQPTEQTLDASAATERAAAANAVVSTQNAAQGSAAADTGAPAVQAAEQFSRAAGGGQRQLSNEADSADVARKVTGQNFEAVATSTQAELAESVKGSAGQTAAAALTADNQTASRAETGAEQSLVGDLPENQSEQAEGDLSAQIAQNDMQRNDSSRSGPAGAANPLNEDEMSTAATAGQSATQRQNTALNASDVGAADAVAAVALPGTGPMNPVTATTAESGVASAATDVQRAETGTAAAMSESSPTDDPQGQQVTAAATTRAQQSSSADAAVGETVAGGGTASPQRASEGTPINALAAVSAVMVEGAKESAGVATGVEVAAQDDAVGKIAGGVQAPPTVGPVGAAAGEEVAQGENNIEAGSVGNRREQSTAAVGDTESTGQISGSQVARSQQGGALAGDLGAVAVAVPELADTGAPSPGNVETSEAAGEYTVGPVSQAFGEAAPVKVEATEGLGGLGEKIAADAGIADRRASAVNATIQLNSSRFNRDTLSGLPALDVHATMAKKSFDGRMNREGGGNGSAGPETEEAIELGLAFLARFQKRDGSWTLQQFAVIDGVSAIESDTAATALAMLAFQGAGYNHQEHQYKEVVAGALNFIITHQTASGDYYMPQGTAENRVARLYGHAIATLAMCEAYGMTQDPDIKDSVQQALNFIVQSQHTERGGWRYTPGRESDTSVTGWMLMAIESGRRAGLEVPEQTFEGIQNWLDTSQDKDQPFKYSYNPYAPVNSRQAQGRVATKTMTSVGLLMRLYLGWDKDDDNSIAGARYLQENLPSIRKTRDASLRDTYYWYYATQFMYHMGGEHWKKWNDRLHPLLVNGQEKNGELMGSWDPRNPVPDRWGPHAGRLYVTAMNLLSLEVHYRHLPLYND